LAGKNPAGMDSNRTWAHYSAELLPWQETKLSLREDRVNPKKSMTLLAANRRGLWVTVKFPNKSTWRLAGNIWKTVPWADVSSSLIFHCVVRKRTKVK
jgi:hypothetical protein